MKHNRARIGTASFETARRGGAASAGRVRNWPIRRRRVDSLRAAAEFSFAYLAALVDAVSIVVAALLAHSAYSVSAFGEWPHFDQVTTLAGVVALFVVSTNAQRREYSISRYTIFSGHVSRCFSAWNVAFFCAFAAAFVTKSTETLSRGGLIGFYALGLLALLGGRLALVRLVDAAQRNDYLPQRRLFVIGFEPELAEFIERHDFSDDRMVVVSAIALRDNRADLNDDLALAAAAARMLRADDVFIVIPWSRTAAIEACVNTFIRTPAEIHLGPDEILGRFGDVRVAQIGPTMSLNLTHAPLSLLQRLEKRAFDLVVATIALVALAPLMAIVAALIRLDSPGPVLFFQKRYGFNQEPFRIAKFRSMTTLEDNAHVKGATRGDPRVTRLGAFLRRYSIDELPQLLNVISGEMSLVGPRPHALAHDQSYVRRISQYARRHNVKPGITGWAQVNGARGEVSSDDVMRKRIEFDLYYVDRWSLWLDVKILVMTIFSPKAHSNAY